MERQRRDISLGFGHETFKEGHHIIFVYNDDFERKRTIAKFLRQGLLDNEKVLYLVDDISPDEMKKEFLDLGVDVNERQDQFDITEGHYTQCPDHCFSGEFMLGVVGEYYDNAVKAGYAGARGAGEMSWALESGRATVPDLLAYEASLNHVLADHPLTTVCQYDARRFNGGLILDMLSVHPMMIVRGQLVKNPSYVAPHLFLEEYRARAAREAANGTGG